MLGDVAVVLCSRVLAVRTVTDVLRIGDPDRELGISFFMVEGDDLRRNLAHIWEGEVEPYLEEVFYDRPEELEDFRWERLAEDRLERWR